MVTSMALLLGFVAFGSATAALQARNLKLNGPLASGLHRGTATDFAFGAGGARVLFRADAFSFRRFELLAAPSDDSAPLASLLDGSSPPVELTPGLPSGRAVSTFQVGTDGQALVYLADAAADERFDLFVVPTDGNATPLALTNITIAGGDVLSFGLVGDCAVLLGDLETDNVIELFRVRLDASQPPARLNGPLIAGGDVVDFQLTPDGTRVVYRADQVADSRIDLFSRASDGSGSTGGSVSSFAVFPEHRVVFRADLDVDERFELYADLHSLDQAALVHPPIAPPRTR